MYPLALVRTYTGTFCADGQHGHCTFLPVSLMCLRDRARVYIRVRACILVQCFVMGNPSHVCVLVFGLSRCNCIATPIDMDSLLVMSLYLCWLFVLKPVEVRLCACLCVQLIAKLATPVDLYYVCNT